VLKGVKDKIAELNEHILPAGVKIEPFYDRTWLMDKTLTTVFRNLVEGAMLVSWCCTSSCPTARRLAVVVVIPLALLATFMGLKIMGVPANLLSPGRDGLRHHRRRRGDRDREHPAPPVREPRGHARGRAQADHHRRGQRSGPADVFSMLIIIAAHIPIFALQRHEGRIFRRWRCR
jgi:cobalt-zinc-cadmium resistance protein CzcA